MGNTVEQSENTSRWMSHGIVGIILIIVAIFAPFAIIYHSTASSHDVAVTSMIWQSYFCSDFYRFNFSLESLSDQLIFTFPRFLIIAMMVRLYQGKTTAKRALLVGVLEIVYTLVFSQFLIPYYFLSPHTILSLAIPTPFLLITSLLMLRFSPPLTEQSWIHGQKGSWWKPE